MTRIILLISAFVSLALLSAPAAQARPKLKKCHFAPAKSCRTACRPITSIPFTISNPGVYCVRRHLTSNAVAGNMIDIQADNVTINLAGWTLDGSTAGSGTTTTGISAFNKKNITIKNGTVRGFLSGINLNQGSGHVVRNVRAEGNTQTGIVIKSVGSLIRNNLILNTGGSTAGTVFEIPAGILMQSPRTQIINNQVINTNGTSASYGIYVGPNSSGAVIHGNRVSNLQVQSSVTSYGIVVRKVGFAQRDIAISNNHVIRMTNCISYDSGTTGIYAHNIVLGCTTPFSGGTAAGSTNFSQ